jgi:hypothetical protein
MALIFLLELVSTMAWNSLKTTKGRKHEWGDCLDCHTCTYYQLHRNVKFKALFKINIINFLIIHVVIDFNGNHPENFG